jgi:hypothetical protein
MNVRLTNAAVVIQSLSLLFDRQNHMLSEDRKTIIEAEERFRHELRTKLDSEAAKLSSSSNHLEAEVK